MNKPMVLVLCTDNSCRSQMAECMPSDDPAEATGGEKERLDVFRCVRDEIGRATHDWDPQAVGARG